MINKENLHTHFRLVFFHTDQTKIVKERMEIMIYNSSDHGTILFTYKIVTYICLFLSNNSDPITMANKVFFMADQQSYFL